MTNRRTARTASLLLLTLCWAVSVPLQGKTTLRLGTIVPKGSAWHDTLLYLRQEWRRISDGEVDLRIYPGGVLGDETEMVRQVRAGRIQAVALSANGLSRIDGGVAALQIPLMFGSYEELDYVRDRIIPKLEQRIESQGVGHKVLFWTDAGWVRFFTKKPARTLDDIRRMRLFTSAGDADTEKLWKSFRFNVVPLSATDMLTSLQTGMIDAFDVPPLFALFNRSYTQAPNMLDLKVAPLIGGVVVSKQAWDRVPEQYRDEMLQAGREAGAKLRDEIRRLGPDSIEQMKKRGLNVIVPDQATLDAWQSEVEAIYPKLRGSYCPADLFDEVKSLRDEYRKSKGD